MNSPSKAPCPYHVYVHGCRGHHYCREQKYIKKLRSKMASDFLNRRQNTENW
jgi:hypothetical protein